MNVVVVIEGREAIPVRAIPLLTDWEVLSPDELAGALTGDYPHRRSFEKLTAYRLENSRLKNVKPRWWSNFPVRQLEALSHRIRHTEINHDDGYEQWRCKSLPVLPPGVFVWKDEFEACFWSAYGPDGETEWVPVKGGFKMRPRKEFIELDFEPFALPELLALVMEGFEPPATTPSSTPEPQAAPVVADSAPGDVELDQTRPLLKLEGATPSPAPNLVENEDYPPLWHALRCDEERMKTAIEALERSKPTSSTEVVSRKEKLEAWRAELAQIHKRMDFIGSGLNMEVNRAAENSHIIKEMANSRPGASAIDVHQRDAEIKDANKKIDALIAEATQPSPAPEPKAATVVTNSTPGRIETNKAGPTPIDTYKAGEEKPWLIANPRDPDPEQDWYTPARYFARQLVRKDSTLVLKKSVLAEKVSKTLAETGFKKRGKKLPLSSGTVLKAFSNINFG